VDRLSTVEDRMLAMQQSMRYDLAIRPAGSRFSEALFGHPDVDVTKRVSGWHRCKTNTSLP